MKAVNSPKYGSRTVLTDSCWEYVSLLIGTFSVNSVRLYMQMSRKYFSENYFCSTYQSQQIAERETILLKPIKYF